jgi:hypothetical protein
MTPTINIADWQMFAYILFALLMLFSAWQGWLHGLGRCSTALLGVAIGYLAGNTLGFLFLDLYAQFIPLPHPMLRMATNLLFGLLVYFIFVTSSIFLFKSTRKQEGLRNQLLYGIGGIPTGILNGLVLTAGILISIRVWGIFQLSVAPAPGSIEFRQKEEVFLPEHLKQDGQLHTLLYRTIRHEPLRNWTSLIDPVPENHYELMVHLRILSVRKDLRERFLNDEKIKGLLEAPEIAALIQDGPLPAMIREGRFIEVLRHPEYRALYQKAGASSLIQSIDWLAITRAIVKDSDLANHPDL